MSTIEIVLGIILIVMAVFLIAAVLMQSGKDKGISGTIAGGAETFFGKSKASTIDKKLSKLTTIVAIVFVILVLVSYLTQDNTFGTTTASSANTVVNTDTVADTAEEAVAEAEEAAEDVSVDGEEAAG